MNPVIQTSRFDLSLLTPQGRSAWAIAAILFGGAAILDLAITHRGHAPGVSRVEPQVIKPHAVEPYADRRITLGLAARNEALEGESRLSLAPARVRHAG